MQGQEAKTVSSFACSGHPCSPPKTSKSFNTNQKSVANLNLFGLIFASAYATI
jgi:hypothetical protein